MVWPRLLCIAALASLLARKPNGHAARVGPRTCEISHPRFTELEPAPFFREQTRQAVTRCRELEMTRPRSSKTSKNYYGILGVPEDANARAIRKSFRELALKYHPDRNPGNAEAEACFKEINEAYGVLSDPEQRATYDQLTRRGPHRQPAGAVREWRGAGETFRTRRYTGRRPFRGAARLPRVNPIGLLIMALMLLPMLYLLIDLISSFISLLEPTCTVSICSLGVLVAFGACLPYLWKYWDPPHLGKRIKQSDGTIIYHVFERGAVLLLSAILSWGIISEGIILFSNIGQIAKLILTVIAFTISLGTVAVWYFQGALGFDVIISPRNEIKIRNRR
jgi:DnaJ-domain-containing protein 1